MEKKIWYGIIIVIVAIILAIAGILISVKEPDVSVNDIEFKSLSTSEPSISFYVTLDVDNDNLLGATLKKVEADIEIDGEFVGTANSEKEHEIKAKSVSKVTVVLNVVDIPFSIFTKSSVEVEVTGTALVKVSLFEFKVPIDKKETLSII